MEINAFCSLPFNRVRITSEGNVAMCCFMRTHNPNKNPYIGNLFENNFDDIWFGPIAEEIRISTIQGNLHSKCQCSGCPFMSMKKPYPYEKVIYSEYPSFLEIDLPNTHCNIGGLNPTPTSACIMCERAAPEFKPEVNRLFEALGKLKYMVRNLSQIHIQGIAEPFYETKNNLLFDILDEINPSPSVIVSLTTNGTLLKQSIREKYFKRVPSSITVFSLDAATPETFKKIRILDCFDKVVENLMAFGKERNRSKQMLVIHNNINLLNVHEVVGMVEIAAKAEVDRLEFNPTDGHNHKILLNEENCGLFHRAEKEIREAGIKHKVQIHFQRPLDLGLTERLIQITL